MTPVASTFQSTTVQQHPTTVQHWSSNSPLATTAYAADTSCLSQHINLSRGFSRSCYPPRTWRHGAGIEAGFSMGHHGKVI